MVISVLFRLNGGGTGAVRLLYRLLSLLLVLSVLRSRPVRASSCHYAPLPDHVQLVNLEAGVPMFERTVGRVITSHGPYILQPIAQVSRQLFPN